MLKQRLQSLTPDYFDMSEIELIERTVKATLKSLGYAVKCEKQYMSQSEALRLLPFGRAKLMKLYKSGDIRCYKEDYEVRNSPVRLERLDVIKYLNK